MAIVTAVLPLALQLIAMALKYFDAKQETLADFEKLVVASADEGLIAEDTKQTFLNQIAQLNAMKAAKQV